MKVHISDHFTFKNIFKITIFPIVMMIFISLYSIVDGIFISNFTPGGDAFTAVNLVFPLIMVIGSIGFMMGAGGTALVSKLLGEQNHEKANSAFSLIIYSTIGLGAIFSIGGYFLIEPIVKAMASISPDTTEQMIADAIVYGKILIAAQIPFMLQNMFQSFFMVAEKSKLGFIFTISAGVTNMVLDALLIGLLRLGVVGASVATITGYCIGGFGPIIYFALSKNNLLRLGRAVFEIKVILKSMYNGMSEFVSNISMSIVSIVYNLQLLRIYGQDGVMAYGIIMYVSFVFIAIFIGYSLGMAPPVGYNYGAKNHQELHNILSKSALIIGIVSIIMALLSGLMATPFSKIFSGGSESLLYLSAHAMRVYSIAFLACGFSIFLSSFFTALNNGTISAIISISRTLVFQIAFAFIFPLLFGDDSLWWAIVTGEVISMFLSLIFLFANKKKYGY